MAIEGQFGNIWNRWNIPMMRLSERDRRYIKILGIISLTTSFASYKMEAPLWLTTAGFFQGSYYLIAAFTGNRIFIIAGVATSLALLIIGPFASKNI